MSNFGLYEKRVCIRCKKLKVGGSFPTESRGIRKKWCKVCDPYWSKKPNAHILVNRALTDGIITKPKHCPICKRTKLFESLDSNNLLPTICGHHEDYDRPLDVIWMCTRCHARYHRGQRAESIKIRVKVHKIWAELFNNTINEAAQPMPL